MSYNFECELCYSVSRYYFAQKRMQLAGINLNSATTSLHNFITLENLQPSFYECNKADAKVFENEAVKEYNLQLKGCRSLLEGCIGQTPY